MPAWQWQPISGSRKLRYQEKILILLFYKELFGFEEGRGDEMKKENRGEEKKKIYKK